jgi:hypothetical protein
MQITDMVAVQSYKISCNFSSVYIVYIVSDCLLLVHWCWSSPAWFRATTDSRIYLTIWRLRKASEPCFLYGLKPDNTLKQQTQKEKNQRTLTTLAVSMAIKGLCAGSEPTVTRSKRVDTCFVTNSNAYKRSLLVLTIWIYSPCLQSQGGSV